MLEPGYFAEPATKRLPDLVVRLFLQAIAVEQVSPKRLGVGDVAPRASPHRPFMRSACIGSMSLASRRSTLRLMACPIGKSTKSSFDPERYCSYQTLGNTCSRRIQFASPWNT
jgi:hypothetical protein